MPGLGQPARGLDPAEPFLDALAQALAGGVAGWRVVRRKLFIDAYASISIPSTEKCSFDNKRRTPAPRGTA